MSDHNSDQTIILTAPVPKATQEKVQELAKSNHIPIRVFVAMLIERGLADIESGQLVIQQPAITGCD
jgi:ribosomal protein L30E